MSVKMDISKKIKKLNSKCSTLHFEFVEEDCYCKIINHSTGKGCTNNSFGAFEYSTANKDKLDKENVYRECDAFLTGLLAGTSLLEPKAYHNFIAQK